MWFHRRRDPRIADELRFHRDRLIEDHLAAGSTPQEAERRAFLALGNVASLEEAVRDVRGRWLEDARRDVGYTLRGLRRSPVFAAVAILSFALGIGANVAIFSVINAVILRSLPVRAPHQLVQITRLADGQPGSVSYPLFEYFRDTVKVASGAFAQARVNVAVAIDGQEEFVAADLVSADYYTTLGIDPAVGRLLGAADMAASASPVAVLSDRYWARRFGRNLSAVGTSMTIRDRVFTIVGVAPAAFQGTRPGEVADVILPLRAPMINEAQRTSADYNWLNLLARLNPGATVTQADAETRVAFASFVQAQAQRAPDTERERIRRQRAGALPAPDGINRLRYHIAQPLLILMGIVGLILTLACLNVSGLLLARATARQREISIRLAIGAGRGRLIRQCLTESLVLALVGSAVGLTTASWFSSRLLALFVNGRAIDVSVAPDWRVFGFTAAVALAACCTAGLAPAIQALRADVNSTLNDARVRPRRPLGHVLVVAQLAISMILLVGATLFVGTLVKLYAVDRGLDSAGVLVFGVQTARPYDPARAKTVQQAILTEVGRIPGVQSTSASAILPLGGNLWDRRVRVEGYVFGPDEPDQVGFNAIAPDYFATLKTPVIVGREFDDRDTQDAAKVAVVNESFARRFFKKQNALGRRVISADVTYDIVGVVKDTKYQTLRSAPIATMYIPWMQREGEQPGSFSYLLRVSDGDPLRVIPDLDSVVRTADPALHTRNAVAYDTVIARSIATERIMAGLGTLFGFVAVLVAGLGVFGLMEFQVARRSNELGVRIALGATRACMMRLVLRDVVVMIAAGLLAGAAGVFILTGLADNLLFGLTASDPLVLALAASILALAATVAGWIPARRAATVDPLVALRHE